MVYELITPYGKTEVQIVVKQVPVMTDEDLSYIEDMAREIAEHMIASITKRDPAAIAIATQQFELVKSLFSGLCYIKTIPNGYCDRYCCKHLPWYLVTTEHGVYEIGHRKHVWHLDWSQTTITKSAEELFPNEETTKSKRMIHAETVEKLRSYVNKLEKL